MGKEKKINCFDNFYILHKSDVKTFLKYFINKCPKGIRNMIMFFVILLVN